MGRDSVSEFDVIYSEAVGALLADYPDLRAKPAELERAHAPIRDLYAVVM